MTLAAIMAALHVSRVDITEIRVVIFGSGSAGTGIADQIADAIATESRTIKEEAVKHIWFAFTEPTSLEEALSNSVSQVYRQTRVAPQVLS